MNWLKAFWNEAKGKWTTWFAASMAALAAIPAALPDTWDSVAYLIPPHHRDQAHKLILAIGFLAVIYLRVRRNVSAQPN